MIGFMLLLTASAVLAVPVTNQDPSQDTLAHDAQWKAVTDGCGQTKSCFLHPEDCLILKNCVAAVSILVVGTTYTFEMQSVGGVYIAVGLSDDATMGDDSVVECVNDASSGADKVKLYASFNKGHANVREPLATGLTLDSDASSYDATSKTAFCKFTRAEVTTFQTKEFNLATTQYHLLLVAGKAVTDTNLAFHDLAFEPSVNKRYVADIGFYQHQVVTTTAATTTSTTTPKPM